MADENQKPTAAAADPAYDMARKRQLHPKADERNRLELVRGREVLTCGARKKKGPGFCRSLAGAGTQHPGYGRCKFCGGSNTGAKTPEGKARTAQNARKHGFYSSVLSMAERELYEEQVANEAIGLQHEIYVLKAKIKVYLGNWRRKWDAFYAKKLAEQYVKYRCTDPDCGRVVVRGELDGKPGYCMGVKCGERHLEEVERWVANRTHEEAAAYADQMTKVKYSEGEKSYNYFHAGTLEDRTLDRALNTLSRLVEKHARLTQDSGEDLVSRINKELQQASAGRVSISWGGKPQTREGGVADGKQVSPSAGNTES